MQGDEEVTSASGDETDARVHALAASIAAGIAEAAEREAIPTGKGR